MKKILLILDKELSFYQMLTYIKQKKQKVVIDVLIQNSIKSIYKYKNNKKFKVISRKSFLIKQPPLPVTFSFLKFWNIFFGYKNRMICEKIQNVLRKNFFNLKDYDEVCFSNEAISHYILYNSDIKKIYFDHSPIDTMLRLNTNFFKKIKGFLECYINNKLMNIYYKGNSNFLQKSIFANFLKKKNSTYMLPIKIFKNIFFKLNKEKVKKFPNLNYNLINFYLPYYAFKSRYSKKILDNYIQFFIENILSKILKITKNNDVLLFKFRQNIPINFQIKAVNIIQKKFPNENFILVNREFPKMINLEKIISNFNIKRYFTSPSSSIFLTKALSSKILIYDYGTYWEYFLKEHWNTFKHKNNYNNYLVASKLYRNISNKI